MPTRESQEVADTDQARETLSRGLLKETRRPQRFELPAPYSLIGLVPGDDIAVTHYGGPDSEGDGWGARPFERELAEIEGVGYDPSTRRFMLGLRDVRNSLLRTTWLPGAIRSQLGRIQDGEGIVCASPRFCWRPTVAYVADPLTGIPVQIYYHRAKLTDKGFLIERMRTNNVKASSFNAGYAGWADNGTGINGSAIIVSNTRLLFAADPPDGPQLAPDQSYGYIPGNPHTADLYSSQVCPLSVTSGNVYLLSFDHVESAQLVAPSFRLLLNGQYWNVGSSAFQVGSIWNALSANASFWTRDFVRFTANFTGQPTIHLGYPSGVNPAASFNAAHVQLDMGRGAASCPWASSRIITGNNLEGTSEGDVVMIDNSTGFRLWTANQGTALFTGTTLWSTAQVAGLFFTWFKVKYDANNSLELFYDGTNQRFTLRNVAGGVTADLHSGVIVITASVPVTVEVRRSGDYGELNDLYGTPAGGSRWFDMIVNGTRVQGTQGAPPIESAASVFVLGGEEGRQIDAYLKAQLTPYVLTENQCAKWRLTS